MRDRFDVYYPFFPSETIDPRQIRSVADQVISEYTFGFYSQESFKRGPIPVFMDIAIDRAAKSITLTQRHPVLNSAGKEFSQQDICKCITDFFKGTVHSYLPTAFKSFDCSGKAIKISLNYIPINIEALFTTTDFSIYDSSQLPLSAANLPPATGPYVVESMTPERVDLKRNHYYPKALVANEVENVSLHWTNTARPEFLRALKPDKISLMYAFGFQLTNAQLKEIGERGYQVEQYPSEWLAYLGFNEGASKETRLALGNVLDQAREQSGIPFELGQPAYSISPSDRDFGLTKDRYLQVKKSMGKGSLGDQITVGIFSEYEQAPIIQFYRKALVNKLGDKVQFRIFERSEIRKIFSSEVQAFLMVLGISPGDPLTHFAFLQETKYQFSHAIRRAQIEDLSKIETMQEFNAKVLEYEKLVLRERLMVPLAHFPGVVIHANDLMRDEQLAWAWGIQPWTYRVR